MNNEKKNPDVSFQDDSSIRHPDKDCDHCWHPLGPLLASNPPQRLKQCCHCGEEQESTSINLDAHGPQHPRRTSTHD